MASLQTYEKGALFADGQLLAEVINFSVSIDSKAQEINTMQKGFAGMSPGSEMTQIEVTSAIPRAGVEYESLAKLQGLKVVEMVLFAGAKKSSTKGYITNVQMQFGADRASEVSFTFKGSPIEQTSF